MNAVLRKAGWRVVRVWGHSLRRPEAVAKRITSELIAARERYKNVGEFHERAI